MNSTCQACLQFRDLDRAHLKTRASGAKWEDWEYIHLCRNCHCVSHSLGWVRFICKYPHLTSILKSKGWQLINEFGVVKLRRI